MYRSTMMPPSSPAALRIWALAEAPRDAAPDLAQRLRHRPDLSTFTRLLLDSPLAPQLDGPSPMTLLAPSDTAFDALPFGALASYERPEHRDALTALLQRHLFEGRHAATSVLPPRTLTGQSPAQVIEADLAAANGLIHVIDRVL